MPGLTKVIVLALLALAAWYGFHLFKRWQVRSESRLRAREGGRPAGARAVEAEDMVQCRICGTYVSPRNTRACARADCPYGGG